LLCDYFAGSRSRSDSLKLLSTWTSRAAIGAKMSGSDADGKADQDREREQSKRDEKHQNDFD
jgi:hypothetical protein